MESKSIKAIDAVRCIRTGMTDAAIMEEFGLSAKRLRRLFEKLVSAGMVTREEMEDRLIFSYTSVIIDVQEEQFPVRKAKKPLINAAEAIACIRSDMDDSMLMKRYNLSIRGLKSLFDKLVRAQVISREEIENRGVPFEPSLVLDEGIQKHLTALEKLGDKGAERILELLRSGIKHKQIMEDFALSRWQLGRVLKGLLDGGLVTPLELETNLREPYDRHEIKNRFSKKVLYEAEAASLGELVESAVKGGVDLSEADLPHVNLA